MDSVNSIGAFHNSKDDIVTSKGTLPLYSLIAFFIVVVGVVLLVIFGKGDNEATVVISALVVAIPGLVAAFRAEQNTNMIRNGVVSDKAKEGAIQALKDTGVVDTVVNAPTTTNALITTMNAHTAALTQLLQKGAPQNGGQTV